MKTATHIYAMTMIEKSVLGLGPRGFHSIAYAEWGDPANDRVLICVPGLTRRSRDFDFFASALEDRYRVVCVDLPGRGASDWLADPAEYEPARYAQDMAALIARLNVKSVDWVGTSLGGLVGMILAVQPRSPLAKLVAVDIGAYIDKAALDRIASYVGTDPSFPDLAALEAYLRDICPFGPLTDAQWAHLARHGARVDGQTGTWRLHYDPRIAEPFKEAFSEAMDLWPLWDAITCPTLVVRGAESDLLTAETTAEMLARNPAASLIEFERVGHAPMLMSDDQIQPVREWLSR